MIRDAARDAWSRMGLPHWEALARIGRNATAQSRQQEIQRRSDRPWEPSAEVNAVMALSKERRTHGR